jgi:hypothetical protein
MECLSIKGYACVGYQITDCYYGDLFSPAMNMFPEHFLSLNHFSACA